jgi:hypothetical protein
LIALDTSVNKIFLILATTCGSWLKMVNGKFSTSMGFGDATISTAVLIAFSDG